MAKVLHVKLMAKAEIIGQTDPELGKFPVIFRLIFIAELKIPLTDLIFQPFLDHQFSLETTPGKLHLQINFFYSFSKVRKKKV